MAARNPGCFGDGSDDMVPRPRHGLSLCAGGGGLDMGLQLAEPGFHTRCYVEWEEYPRQAIIAAQRAGYFAPAPIWDDVTTFDGKPWRGHIDTVLAGYPCQPFSQAGQRKGADDERHLWPDVARIIREVEPRWVFLENVAGHVSLGAETVLRELWDMGWTPAAGLFSAEETGAPHERLRWFCVAYRDSQQSSADSGKPHAGSNRRHDVGWRCGTEMDHPASPRRSPARGGADQQDGQCGRKPMPCDGRAAMGHPARLGRNEGRAEPIVRGGRDTVASAGGTVADASGPEREGQQRGQQRGQHHARGRQVKDGYSSLPGGTGLFPPGPADSAAWSAVLRSAPDMAPSAAARDLHTWARHMEADGRKWWQAETEPEFRRMVDGLADRTPKLRLLGNGVVPICAGHAWRALSDAHGLRCLDLEAAGGDAGSQTDGTVLMPTNGATTPEKG